MFLEFYLLNIKCQRNPASPNGYVYNVYARSVDDIRPMTGTATTERSEEIRAKIGGSHPTLHSTCASKNVRISPLKSFQNDLDTFGLIEKFKIKLCPNFGCPSTSQSCSNKTFSFISSYNFHLHRQTVDKCIKWLL